MALRNAFAVKLGTTVLAGLQGIDSQMNPEVDNEPNLGSNFPQFAAITAQKPKLMFTSRSVASCLGLLGSTGATIDGTTSLIAYWAKLDGIGNPLSGNVHRSYTATRGLILPRRLSCQHRQSAQLDVEVLLYSSDGVAHPVAISDTATLPTIVRAFVQHTLGPITLGITGTTFTVADPTQLTIDFANNAATAGSGSDLYDKYMEQQGIRPVINISGIDAELFGTGKVPPVGTAITHAGTTIFLRKRKEDGIGFVANGTAEHIKVTVNGVAVVTSHRGTGNGKSEVSLQITTNWDGTNAPIVFDTASAIA